MRGGLDRQIQTTEGPGTKGFEGKREPTVRIPQKGDPKGIKGLGGQDGPEGGPDSQGRVKGGP